DTLKGLVLDFLPKDKFGELWLSPQGDPDSKKHDHYSKADREAGDGDGKTEGNREKENEQGEPATLKPVFQLAERDVATGGVAKYVPKVIAQSARRRRRMMVRGWSEDFRTHEGQTYSEWDR